MRQLASILILILVAGTAQASDADVLREIRDRNEIQALMWSYVRALDTFDADGYAAVYAPDGQFGSGTNAAKGRDALKAMVANLKKGRAERAAKGEKVPPMHHMITNYHVEFVDKDHARYHAYWLTVFGQTGEQGSTPRVAAEGRSVDELVRLDGKWLIKSRDVAPKD